MNSSIANQTMETGIILEDDDAYKVKYIARRSAADRKSIDIKPGDVFAKSK